MRFEEYYVVRDVESKEIKSVIDDYKSSTPQLRDEVGGEWSDKIQSDIDKMKKNLSFKEIYEMKTNKILDSKEIKNYIVDFIEPSMFIDIIYPKWCETEEDCIKAIKQNTLYWLFYIEDFSTLNNKGEDIKIGDIYVKFNTITGDTYIVKSLHRLNKNAKNEIISDRDITFIHVYTKFMNGELK